MVEKIGPYRVYERLGVGGMGEVFKAYDDRLDRWVAIKRIRPDREDAEDNRERFKREARATARLNHPAIVHLYGIFQEGESDCIVMEYVEGRTLDSILAEGPLDPLRVASLGHEIASGLAEAHANGILHRDLKAENIIITPRGRSKILDFGLAKPILRSELDPVLTGKGQLVGTSRAMSPEYVSGDNVDHRSDLFALGVLLYETLTGQSPFKAHNTLATLKQVMLHKQMPVKQLAPKVPQELSDLIDRLLEKDPADRPQSAHEVALAFGRLTGQISSGSIDQPSSGTQPIFKPTTSTGTPFSASDTVLDLRPRSRWMTVVAVLVALLITAFFLGRYLKSDEVKAAGGQQAPTAEPIQVLLGTFQNSTGQEKFDVTVAELFRASLQQSEAISLLSDVQIAETLKRMERPASSRIDAALGSEIAQREGVSSLIIGSISSIGTKFAISAQVIRPSDQVVRFTKSMTANNEDEIIPAIQAVGNEIRSSLGETAAEIERTSQPLEKVTTRNFEALRAYTYGIQKQREGLSDEAISSLNRALDLDPAFAMAHAKLVAIYSNDSEAKARVHLQAAQANRDRLTEVEKYYIDGWSHRWTGTPKDVIHNWSEMSSLHPREFAAHRNLGLALFVYQNDLTGAAQAFENAFAIADAAGRPEVARFLAYCLLGSGQTAKSKQYFEIASEINKVPLIEYLLATGERQQANLLISSSEQAAASSALMALVHADRGDLDTAEGILKQTVAISPPHAGAKRLVPDWDAYTSLLTILYLKSNKQYFEKLAADLLEVGPQWVLPKGLNTDLSSVTALTVTGKFLARLGEPDKAEKFAHASAVGVKKLDLPLWNGHQAMLESEILMARGQYEPALKLLDAALTNANAITIRESRAYCLERLGRNEAALSEWLTISKSREPSFTEGHLTSFGRLFTVASTSLAHDAIVRLATKTGNGDLAESSRAAFAALWPNYRQP